jgi:hypothetical protein
MRVTPVRNFGKKTRYDISNRHEEEEPERRERAEEREGRSPSARTFWTIWTREASRGLGCCPPHR